jgi:uncharacterized protein YbjT (DUF2867 family)
VPDPLVVAGATGLVGRALCELLAARGDASVVALVRRPGAALPAGVEQRVFDYEDLAAYAELAATKPRAVFCCLGTTRAKAGSDDAFRTVDRDYPVRLIESLKSASPSTRFGLVSSVGADAPRGLYLTTKAEVERALTASGLPWVIVRPSFLKGPREERRIGELVGLATLGPVLSGLGAVSKGLRRFAPIEGSDVARALAHAVLDSSAPASSLEGAALFDAAAAYRPG